VENARRKYGVSERQACRILQQWRGTQRYVPMVRNEEEALTGEIIALASASRIILWLSMATLSRVDGG